MGGDLGREAAPLPTDPLHSDDLLHIDVRADHPRRAVLVLRGELDHVTADDVLRTVEQMAAAGHDEVVLDLSVLSFMDAGGLKLLYGLRDGAAGATCAVVDGSEAAAHLLELIPDPCPLPPADIRPAAAGG